MIRPPPANAHRTTVSTDAHTKVTVPGIRPALFRAPLAVPACSLGPRYKRPDIATPAAWVAADDATAAAWPGQDWWRQFNSADLNSLLEQAHRANDDLGAAVARVREADAQRRLAGAALLPSVTATGSAARGRSPAPTGGFQEGDQFEPLLTVGYEFDFWGKNWAAYRAARATAAASRYDRETVELTVMASVAGTYFQVLELRERVAVAGDNLASASHILRGLRLEQRVGTATALDVAQQETSVATLNASIPPLIQQLRQATDALAILVGRTPESLEVGTASLDELAAPAVTAGLPSELLERRPDVASAEAQLIAANANVAVARAAFFPSISLTATGGFESSALSTLLEPASRIWSLGAGLSQPIFEGGALRAQSAYAKARYSELLANYHKAVISAFGNTEDALSEVRQTTDQLEREQVAVAQASRAFDIAQAQLKAGTINVLTLLNTQMALFAARDALAQVKLARLQASLDLFRALGGGWTERADAQGGSQ
jgi:outer membrane protein, multidrug efflux system